MEAAEALAVVIRAVRRGQGQSQEDLSSIGRSHISRIERGEANITIDVLIRIASILDVDPAALLSMATSLQIGEPFAEGLKRLSRQLARIKKDGIETQIEELAQAEKSPPGRPARSDAAANMAEAYRMRNHGLRVVEIAQALKLSEATVRRYLKAATPIQ